MHSSPSTLTASLASAFQIPFSATRPTTISSACRSVLLKSRTPSLPSPATRTAPFSCTASQLVRKKASPRKDRRITLIRFFLNHPTTLTPRPLRLSRTRSLRHWTIHRAWQLYRHKLKASRLASLELQYNAMRDACEELRIGAGDGGRLFRKAMMKTGVFGVGKGEGVPMEYARGLVDYVGSVDGLGKEVRVWDEGWKR